jgi:hypothetical protein
MIRGSHQKQGAISPSVRSPIHFMMLRQSEMISRVPHRRLRKNLTDTL